MRHVLILGQHKLGIRVSNSIAILFEEVEYRMTKSIKLYKLNKKQR